MEHWHGARNIGTLAMMLWRYRVSHSVPDPDPELLMHGFENSIFLLEKNRRQEESRT